MKQGIHPKTVSEHFSYKDMFITLNRYSHVLPGMQVDAVKICSERPFE
ncbi:integrase [Bacillus thuringiensis serovar silo]|uniref:Integrase n=1 Tax=Bacillus thuringiensis subsp. darmstadiensis TaxID=132264 RepID=A0A9X6IWQ1_BACUD|nr:integrase [Bacillus thuringiensis serovar silo]OTW61842.1 integrase [Bacillus thuringiensis serovar toguchini]OTZ35432.1 integrase [Bacillus thuringiensis serovar darmstadiensis]PER44500.1 integrase [Bacillus thuringiensis]PES31968.1 integrase [Bacillus thuringiensis]